MLAVILEVQQQFFNIVLYRNYFNSLAIDIVKVFWVFKEFGKKDIKITYENKKGEKKVKRVNPDKSFEFKKDIDYRTLKVGDTVNKETILSIEEVNRVWQFEANSLYFKSKDELIEILNNSELSQYTDKIIKNHYDLNKKIENFS